MFSLDKEPSLASGLSYAVPALTNQVVYEGWVLKKRRKKLQGFARRYFVLRSTGMLCYSFGPGQPVRDQIALPHAAISTSPGHKDIHLDTNTATFHIKCLSAQDFAEWMGAFRKFIVLSNEARRSLNLKTLPRNTSFNVNRSNAIVDDIGLTISQLENAIHALTQEGSVRRHHSSTKSKLKEHARDGHGSVFSMFKKEKERNGASPEYEEDYSEMLPSSEERVKIALDTLKSQHALLVKFIQSLNQTNTSQAIPEENETPSRLLKRTSLATTGSSASEWYDAVDNFSEGPEEFFLDHDDSVEPWSEPPSRVVSHISESEGETDEGADTDEEEGEGEREREEVAQPTAVVRRTQLPSLPAGDEGSLFSILKKNVGKDLATIAVPVTFNEPLTLLQRLCEEVEYYDLLTQAATTTDPTERLAYIAAFTVSSYAHTRLRSGRKGFNPMLGETFEDARMKFVAEKVVHHPLVMAYHAEGPGWDLTSTTAGKTKFWGKSLEIIPIGITRLRIGGDTFEWNHPSSFIRNVMMGTKYLEHVGTMTITNTTDNSKCILEFKQSGYWGPSNAVSGVIHSSAGSVVGSMEGKWDESISQVLDNSHLRVLWRINPFPKNAHEYYGFTSFGITLNEITSDIQNKLPPTDSRLRRDVRALEEGQLDEAEAEKTRTEEMQRERRKVGKDVQPRWFRKVGEDDWIYVGGYWEARSKDWKDAKMESLW